MKKHWTGSAIFDKLSCEKYVRILDDNLSVSQQFSSPITLRMQM